MLLENILTKFLQLRRRYQDHINNHGNIGNGWYWITGSGYSKEEFDRLQKELTDIYKSIHITEVKIWTRMDSGPGGTQNFCQGIKIFPNGLGSLIYCDCGDAPYYLDNLGTLKEIEEVKREHPRCKKKTELLLNLLEKSKQSAGEQ